MSGVQESTDGPESAVLKANSQRSTEGADDECARHFVNTMQEEPSRRSEGHENKSLSTHASSEVRASHRHDSVCDEHARCLKRSGDAGRRARLRGLCCVLVLEERGAGQQQKGTNYSREHECSHVPRTWHRKGVARVVLRRCGARWPSSTTQDSFVCHYDTNYSSQKTRIRENDGRIDSPSISEGGGMGAVAAW